MTFGPVILLFLLLIRNHAMKARHSMSSIFTIILACHEACRAGGLPHAVRTDEDWLNLLHHMDAPFNVSVAASSCSPPSITVSWQFNSKDVLCDEGLRDDQMQVKGKSIKSFQVSYHLLHSANRRIFVEVPCNERNVSLDPLLPNQEYLLQVSSMSDSGVRNSSTIIRFVSPSDESSNQLFVPPFPRKTRGKFRHLQNQYPYSHYEAEIELPFIKMDEAIIVVFVLCFWFVVILVFCHKWGAIRHLEPYHPDFHKRESTDTEVIVDPFSSFSATHYNPKLQSRVNTLNNANNSGSASNFASLETNPGDKMAYPTRRTSSMSCVNEMHKFENYKRTVSHSSSSRFNYHSFTPRLYQCSSTSACHQKRLRDHRPSLVQAPELRHPSYSHTNSYGARSCRPSFSVSSYSYSRRSSMQPPVSYSAMRFCPTQPRITSSPTSKTSSPTKESLPGRHHSLHNSLFPLPHDFQLSSRRKIKSAGDLVLELTIASRRERASREQIAESFQ